jgi:phage nucleotide-binding protein
MEIKSTQKVMDKQGIFAVVYAESGVGKTSMVPNLGKKPLLIDFEGGASVLSDKDIDMVTVEPTLEEYKKVMKDVNNLKGYDTVIFDGITAMELNLLAYFGKTSSSMMPSLNNYGVLNSALLQSMTDMRALKFKGINVLVTATEMSLEESLDDGRIISKIYPNVSAGKGKYAKRLVAEADIVGRLVISKKDDTAGKRFIILEKQDNFVAKDRIFKRKFCEINNLFKKGDK